MKISIVQGAFLPVPALLGGAVEKVWHALGQEFARQGHAVTHISRAHPDLPSENFQAGVYHRRVAGYSAPRALWRLKLLDLAYSQRVSRVLPRADVLVTNTFWLPLIERRRACGCPYVHVARYPKGQLRLYPRRAILQTVSSAVRDAILREVPEAGARTRVIPYPLSPQYLVPHAAAGRVVLYAGRIHPEKGLHLLIEAYGRVPVSDRRGWILRMVGPWRTSQGGGGMAYRNQLATAARRLGPDVQFLEPVFDERQLVALYREAAIFAYPSLAERGETFGLAALEAMAAGCAPIVSALGCFRDFVRPNENGFVFDHRAADPAGALGDALGKLMQAGAARERLREAAWSTAREYTLPGIAARFLEDFRSIQEIRQSASAAAAG